MDDRGFAGVAGKVRTLAQRSASAAKEIKDRIDASVPNVTNGSQLVENAGQTVGEVVRPVKQVTDIMVKLRRRSASGARASNR
ncbi:methyl-accepting chemotaxis protein [Paraburkholderia rhynchosiae]|uniref:Methyl-accepting transducer domain-containing protein n=1 Tax=Paraburkholderia rhynchosiae TaxID=487049 RepID=A0A6J5CDE5_9BURK|nr:hypothetical protein LMG27174_05882 [Paraburkholderia rhynchosiae]